MTKASNKLITNFVLCNSYLQKRNSDENDLSFATRRNCWGGVLSEHDLDEAYRVKNLLIKTFPFLSIEVEVSTCDEWVSITIENKSE